MRPTGHAPAHHRLAFTRASFALFTAASFFSAIPRAGAGTVDPFSTGTDLTSAANYSNGAPTNTSDVNLTTASTGLTISGGAAVTMESLSANSATAYTISNGTSSTNSTLTLGNSAGFTNANDSTVNDLISVASSGTLSITTGSSKVLGLVLASSGNFDNNSSAGTGLTISANISGAQTLTLSGTGTSSFTGTNAFSSLAVTAGELDVSSDASLGAVPTSATADISINGGRLGSNSGTTFTINANRTVLLGSAAGTSFSVKGSSGVVTYNGSFKDLTAGGILVKQGAGTLILGGSSTYTGSTSINNGTVQLGAANALPTATVMNIGQAASTNLGSFNLNGYAQTVAGLMSTAGTSTSTTLFNTVTSAAAATLTINTAAGATYAYGGGTAANSGVITGAVSLLLTGAGTQSLGGADTYSGSTTVNGGMLVAGTATGGSAMQALGGTSGIVVNGGGTLQMGAANQFNTTAPAPLTLNGATGAAAAFNVNGNSQGSTTANGVGMLTLMSGSKNNVVDFGSTTGVVTFASLVTNGATLTINNYLNNNGQAGQADQLIFNQAELANLGNIVFTGYGAATETELGTSSFYEIYPTTVPEPSAVAPLGGCIVGAFLGMRRARRRSA